METFFTSDTHFCHTNIIKYDNRPFNNVGEMNDILIQNWNKKVNKKDSVYILGDFSFGKEQETLEILNKLNGKKFLIKGNHDSVVKFDSIRKKFVYIKDYDRINLDGKDIIMFHYPIDIWDKAHHGSIHLFGHVHSNIYSNHPMNKPNENSYNVGVDVNNFEPCTIEEVINNNIKWHKINNW